MIQFPLADHDICSMLITPFVIREKGSDDNFNVNDMPTTTTAFNYHKHPLSLVSQLHHPQETVWYLSQRSLWHTLLFAYVVEIQCYRKRCNFSIWLVRSFVCVYYDHVFCCRNGLNICLFYLHIFSTLHVEKPNDDIVLIVHNFIWSHFDNVQWQKEHLN